MKKVRKIRSKNKTGVYYEVLANGDKSYFVTYKNGTKKEWVKVGLHSEGVREAYCASYRADIMLKLRLGEDTPVSLKNKIKYTLHDVAVQYFEKKSYKKSTKRTLWGRYVNHLQTAFGERGIETISEDEVEALYNKKRNIEEKSEKTSILIIEQLSAIMNYAVSKKIIDTNPCKALKFKKVDNARIRYLSKEEVELLIESVKDDYDVHLFILLSLSTGARLHDVYSIPKKHFNIQNRTVTIENRKGKSTYQAFLNKRVLKHIELDHLTPNQTLYTVSERTIVRRLQSKLNELFNEDLAKNDRKNRVVIHTLRHTFASHLVMNGTPIYTVMKLMDHKNIEDTLRYAKLSPENGRDFVEGLF